MTPTSPEAAFKISLISEIQAIQQAAAEKRQKIKELGVFILVATPEGDAWLLEITESDAVQLAVGGDPLDVPIDENPETIEINWSHTFDLRNRQFELTAYQDKARTVKESYPAKEISAAIKRIKKRFSSEALSKVHVDPASEEQAA